MSSLPASSPAAASVRQHVIWINGQSWPLMSDNRFPLLHYFAEGTVLFDPSIQPAREIALCTSAVDYGVTRQRLQPNAHYHAFYRGNREYKSDSHDDTMNINTRCIRDSSDNVHLDRRLRGGQAYAPPSHTTHTRFTDALHCDSNAEANQDGAAGMVWRGGSTNSSSMTSDTTALIPILSPYTCLYITSGLPPHTTREALICYFAGFDGVREGDVFCDAQGRCTGRGWVVFDHPETLWLVPRELHYDSARRAQSASPMPSPSLPYAVIHTELSTCTPMQLRVAKTSSTLSSAEGDIGTRRMLLAHSELPDAMPCGTRSSVCLCGSSCGHVSLANESKLVLPGNGNQVAALMLSASCDSAFCGDGRVVEARVASPLAVKEDMPTMGSLTNSMESNGLSCGTGSEMNKCSPDASAASAAVLATELTTATTTTTRVTSACSTTASTRVVTSGKAMDKVRRAPVPVPQRLDGEGSCGAARQNV